LITFEPETPASRSNHQKTRILVSNENLSEIPSSSSLGWGTDEVSQKGLKQLHLWRHSQKTWNQHVHCWRKTCQIFWGCEQLSS